MSMKLTGLKDINKKMEGLTKATQRNNLRKSLKAAAEPIAEEARRIVPEDKGDLKASIVVSTKLNKTQSRMHKRANGKGAVEIHVGSTSSLAHLQEFGTSKMGAQPFMRPAFSATQDDVVETLAEELKKNISAALGRAARKAAKDSQ